MSETAAEKKRSPWLGRLWRHRAWVLLGLTILFVVVVRVRLREMPLERDEGEYAYAGQLILHGVPPYKEAYNMKLPGTYAAYAAIMAVFGQTSSGIHLGVMLVNVASIVLVFLLGRKLLDDITGIVAAVCFGLMSLSPSTFGLAGHATHFVVLPALAGMLLLVWGVDPPSSDSRLCMASARQVGAARGRGLHILRSTLHAPRLFLSGLCFGLAFLMKQHGVFFGVFGGLYLIWIWAHQRLEARQNDKEQGRGAQPPRAHARRRYDSRAPLHAVAVPSAPRLNAIQVRRLAQERKLGPDGQGALSEPGAPALSQSPVWQTGGELVKAEDSEPKGGGAGPGGAAAAPFNPSAPHVASSVTLDAPAPHSHVVGLRDLLIYGAGSVLPYLLTCVLLWWAGVFHQFTFWTASYAAQYASTIPFEYAVDALKDRLPQVAGTNLAFWLLPWAGALVMWWDRRLDNSRPREGHRAASPPPARRFFLVALVLCSMASVSVGFHFRQHYFITLLPVLGLLSGAAVSRGVYLLLHDRSLELLLAVPILVMFLVGLLVGLFGESGIWFTKSPAEAVRQIYGTSLFCEAVKTADYIKSHTPSEARVAILGSEPEVFFYSGRRSATGYIYTYPLMEKQPYALKMQEEMIAEIEKAKPEYVIYVDDQYSWVTRPDSELRIFDWWQQYWAANLELVSVVSIDSTREAETIPGVTERETDTTAPSTPKQLLLFKRK